MSQALLYSIMLILLVHINVDCEIISGSVSSEKEETFVSKFNFMSLNSSLQFQFAYSEIYAPLRLRLYWDSPIAWVDTFHMRVACPKKQAILNRLSSGQIIHLDPSMNNWCQKIPLSSEIMEELKYLSPERQSNHWAATLSSMVAKISGASRDAKGWLDPIASLITPKTPAVTSTTSLQPNVTTSQTMMLQDQKGMDLPKVLKLAWKKYHDNKSSKDVPQMTNWIYCTSPPINLRFTRAVWWFFVLERCMEEQSTTPSPVVFQSPAIDGVEAVYEMTIRNGMSGDFFREHFSSEKFGNMEMDIVFLLFLSTILLFGSIIAFKLRSSHQLHPTVLICLFSITVRFTAQLLRLVAESHFAITGVRNMAFAILIQLLYCTSTSALFSALLLLSSGYTVVHRSLSRPLVITLCLFLGVYTIMNATTHVAIVMTETRGDVLSRYHSHASYVFVSLQLAAWIGFCISCGYTLFTSTQRRLFLIRLVTIFSIWFWNIPLWIIVTTGATHKRFTENLIRVWDELITLGAYVILLLILRPENANTVFPFHMSHMEGTSCENIIPPQKPTKTEKTLPNLLAPIRSTDSPRLSRSRPRTPDTPRIKSVGKPETPKKPLSGIGGKPGDTPAPGFTLSHNLAEIAATEGRWPNRPRTTPNMNISHAKLEPKHASAN